jgi:glycosyltransferase involved in cell wall biosynthesis
VTPDGRIHILELRSVRGTGGGPEKTILLGAARADRDRFDVTVCYCRDRRDQVFRLDERAARLGIRYVEAQESHSLDPRIWAQLREIVRRHRIDLVHAHEYKTDVLALLLARRTGIIPLATAHAWTGQSARERYLYSPLDKWVLRRFPRVIAVSTEIREELLRAGLRDERITVLLNAIDPQAFVRDPERRTAVRRALGYSPDDVVLGAVGRLERQKRFDLLLEAVAQLRGARPHLRLCIVGDGSLRRNLQAVATRLELGSRCAFLGHRDDVADLHQAFDLFVQSSEYEGTPNAVLEAMAMETPIVATDVGGTRELAADGIHAIIVPAHNVRALQQAIEDVVTHPDAAKGRAAAARRRVEEDLSFEARTRRLETIYSALIEDRRRHA